MTMLSSSLSSEQVEASKQEDSISSMLESSSRWCLSRSLLLLFVQRPERHVGHLDYLEAHTWNIADGVALTTEAGHEHLIVFLQQQQQLTKATTRKRERQSE